MVKSIVFTKLADAENEAQELANVNNTTYGVFIGDDAFVVSSNIDYQTKHFGSPYATFSKE